MNVPSPQLPDEPAAKLWELLRRNERFQAEVNRLAKWQHIANAGSGPDGARGRDADSAWSQGSSLLDCFDEQNPFAADALRWLVPEPIFRQRRIRTQPGTRYTLETTALRWSTTTGDPELKRQWKRAQLSKRLNLSEGEPNRWGPEIECVTSDDPLLADVCRDELAEWRGYFADGNKFTVETPWSEAPPGLQRSFRARWADRSGKGRVAETTFFRDWHLVDLTARAHRALKEANQLVCDLVADLGRVGRGEPEKGCPPVPTQGGNSLRVVPQVKFHLTVAEKQRLLMFDDLAQHRVFVLPHLQVEAEVESVIKELKRQLLGVLAKTHALMGTPEFWRDFVAVDAIERDEHTDTGEAIRRYIYRSPEMSAELRRKSGISGVELERHFHNGELYKPGAGASRRERKQAAKAKKLIGPILRAVNQRERPTVKRRVEFMRSLVEATFPRPDFATLNAQPQHKRKREA